MLYAFLIATGTTLLGAVATALLLWRKALVEKSLAETQAQLKASQIEAQSATAELATRAKDYQDKTSRAVDELATVKDQRDKALAQLAKTGAPGSITDLLRLQTNSLPSTPDPKVATH